MNCNSINVDELIPRGNDFYLQVNLYKQIDSATTVPFDLTVCDEFDAVLIRPQSSKAVAHSIGIVSGTTNSIILDAKNLTNGEYIVETSGKLNGRSWRCAERGIVGVTEFNADSDVTWTLIEGENSNVIDMTFQLIQQTAVIGKNAYELAKEQGYVGSLQDFIEEMVDAGESAAAARAATESAITATNATIAATESAITATNATIVATNSAITATQNANTATQNAIKATNSANTATQNAIAATENANTATTAARAATESAITATNATIAATNSATTATQNTITATNAANLATNSAITATNKANAAADRVDTSIESANTATQNAITATNSAITAAVSASTAAVSASTATVLIERNEAIRQANEETRQENESTRQTNEEHRETVMNGYNDRLTNVETNKADSSAITANYYDKTQSDAKYEVLANKATDFVTVNDTKYPTTKAVDDYLDTTLEDYAKKDGYYESMGVGQADNLSGQDVKTNSNKFRTAAGSEDIATGNARIEGLKGNSIAWNQLLVDDTKFVDMGLPSGTLWATCNIDVTQADGFATTPYTYKASYFSWGNVEGHNPSGTTFDYDFGGVNEQSPYYDNQPYGDTSGSALTTDIPYNDTYDAARVNCGLIWRIPTKEQWQELIANTIYINANGDEIPDETADKRIIVKGVVGTYLQSTINDNRLFLTVIGNGSSTKLNYLGARLFYRSIDYLDEKSCICAVLTSSNAIGVRTLSRYIGIPIRPVINKSDLVQEGRYSHKFALTSNNKNIVDTSIIYGYNQEPSTVAQFESDFKKWFGREIGDEPYDVGTLINTQDFTYKTVGFNLLNTTTGKAKLVGTYGNTDVANGLYCYEIIGNYTSITDEDGNAITPTNGFFMVDNPQEITVTGFDENTCIHLTWSGWRNGETELYWSQTAQFDITQLTGKLNGEGESVVVFPEGMKKAGNAYDEIKIENGVVKAIKRIKTVDLGSLYYANVSGRYPLRNNQIDFYCLTPNLMSNLSCERYRAASTNAVYPTINNKSINLSISGNRSSGGVRPGILIYDLDYYMNPSGLKAALDGVMLNYEATTPQEYILDDFELPVRIKVDDFGTEEQVTLGLPMNVDISYAVNAVDTLRRLSTNYISSESMDNFLAALSSAMGGTWSKTYNSETSQYTFIFTPNS